MIHFAVLFYPDCENWQTSGLPGQVDFAAGQVTFHGHLAKGKVTGRSSPN